MKYNDFNPRKSSLAVRKSSDFSIYGMPSRNQASVSRTTLPTLGRSIDNRHQSSTDYTDGYTSVRRDL